MTHFLLKNRAFKILMLTAMRDIFVFAVTFLVYSNAIFLRGQKSIVSPK